MTSGSGFFEFLSVRVGTYTVRAEATGFEAAEKNVTVSAGFVTDVDIRLNEEESFEYTVLEYRKFGEDQSRAPGDPLFDPDESPIKLSGTDISHAILHWVPPEQARRIVAETASGAETYYVSGDIPPPVRIGDCVGECTECAPACDTFRCYCGGNTRLTFCNGTVRIILTDGRSAFVRVCLK